MTEPTTLQHILNRFWMGGPSGHAQRRVWSTLKAFAEDPRRLGGELGTTAVLHTLGQNLSRHVHLHCLIPGGVFRPDGQWKSSRGTTCFRYGRCRAIFVAGW